MNKSFIAAAILGLFLASPVWAETPVSDSSQEDDQTLCERYIREERIPSAQVEEYMSQCLRDLKETAQGDYDPTGPGEELPEGEAVEPVN